MARQTDSAGQVIEREVGDACPRNCTGTLQPHKVPNPALVGPILECDVCHHQFTVNYKLPMTEAERLGVLPPIDIPEEALRAMAMSLHAKELAENIPNPSERLGEEWDSQPEYVQDEFLDRAREMLIPLWGEISTMFETITFMTTQGRAAMDALTEIAIPSLKYCEEKYGHDDQARLNIEAAIRSE